MPPVIALLARDVVAMVSAPYNLPLKQVVPSDRVRRQGISSCSVCGVIASSYRGISMVLIWRRVTLTRTATKLIMKQVSRVVVPDSSNSPGYTRYGKTSWQVITLRACPSLFPESAAIPKPSAAPPGPAAILSQRNIALVQP